MGQQKVAASAKMSTAHSTPTFGKRNWGFTELKEVLDIQLLRLRCHAPRIIPDDMFDVEEGQCENSISIFHAMKVRGLLIKLSNTPSDDETFSRTLRQLSRGLCCKSIHEDYEVEVFETFRHCLDENGKAEGRYLQVQKDLQDTLGWRRHGLEVVEGYAAGVETEDDDFSLKKHNTNRSSRRLPKSRSVVLASRDPELVHHGESRPVFHFIRHGEQAGDGEEDDYYNRDPDLSEKGIQECTILSQKFNRHQHVTHLIVSPLSRCIDTAVHAFGPTIETGVHVTLVPEIQAAGSCWSCVGLPSAELRAKYRGSAYGSQIDYNWVSSDWINKLHGVYSCDELSVYKRVKDVFKWARDEQDADDGPGGKREIVFITHKSILQHFDHYWEIPHASWSTFTFDKDWKIYETVESKTRRQDPDPQQSEPFSPASSTSTVESILPAPSRIPKSTLSSVKYRQIPRRATYGSLGFPQE